MRVAQFGSDVKLEVLVVLYLFVAKLNNEAIPCNQRVLPVIIINLNRFLSFRRHFPNSTQDT